MNQHRIREEEKRTERIGPRKGTCFSTSTIFFNASIDSSVRNGDIIFGPLPSIIVKSTPRAGNGVRISAH